MNPKSKIWNGAVLLFCALSLVGSLLLVDRPSQLLKALRGAQPAFLLGAVGCMVGYWALESFCLHLTTRRLYPAQKLRDSVTIAMIGQLFN